MSQGNANISAFCILQCTKVNGQFELGITDATSTEIRHYIILTSPDILRIDLPKTFQTFEEVEEWIADKRKQGVDISDAIVTPATEAI